MNTYRIGFIGSSLRIIIKANTMIEAKRIFADKENISYSSYITGSKIKMDVI